MDKVISTLISVGIAVGGFLALWIGANLIFNQVRKDFSRFSVIVGSILGAAFMAIIDGNSLVTRATATKGEWPLKADYLVWPVVGALIVGGGMFALSKVHDRPKRFLISIATFVGLSLLIAFTLKTGWRLRLKTVPLFIWPIALAAVGAATNALRARNPLHGALTGGFIGWLLGTFGGGINAQNASSSTAITETLIACVVAGILLGARVGMTHVPNLVTKAKIDDRSRAWIFIGPAVAFISVMLILPTILTIILSVKDNKGDQYVGLDNYRSVFRDDDNWDLSSLSGLFTSSILPWVGFFLLAAIGLAVLLGRETKQGINFGGAPIFPLIMAGGLFSFAFFTHARGTIFNNLWWVVGVTLLATSLGLAVAKFADGAKFESVAKSFVFMPMAISMVGASIVWRLIMYQARNEAKPQTGVLNAIWVWLGDITTTWGLGRVVVLAIFLGAAAALIYAFIRALPNSTSTAFLYLVLTAPPLWIALRTATDGIGGYVIKNNGSIAPGPINFVQGPPFNNFWLMLILIWIQTGFAMVILSASIKSVPDDYLEAASMDGATDSQKFWRITLPQILPTIGVVATTIMVNVMKVFDIVKVTTNGQFGSQVLANAMFQQAFQFGNSGTGAALAVMLFAFILPIMVLNISRLTKEA